MNRRNPAPAGEELIKKVTLVVALTPVMMVVIVFFLHFLNVTMKVFLEKILL